MNKQLIAIVALLACAPAVVEAGTYACRQLGESERFSEPNIRGINGRGEVVGEGHTSFGWSPTTLVWKKNGSRPVRLGPGGRYSVGSSINDVGHVVGWLENPDNSCCQGFAALWADGATIKLRAIGGLKNGGSAEAINNSEQIVGYSATGKVSDPWHATLWDHGAVIDLGALVEGQSSSANDINEEGAIVGNSGLDSSVVHAARWSADGIVDLGVLEGGHRATALAVNRRMTIVGESEFQGGPAYTYRPVAWVKDKIRVLGLLPGHTQGTARDVNDADVIVGATRSGDDEYRATIWFGADAPATDLNTLMADGGCHDGAGDVWALAFAVGINKKGAIAVQAWRNTDTGRRVWANFVASPTAD